MIKCRDCGHENENGVKYCAACGAPLASAPDAAPKSSRLMGRMGGMKTAVEPSVRTESFESETIPVRPAPAREENPFLAGSEPEAAEPEAPSFDPPAAVPGRVGRPPVRISRLGQIKVYLGKCFRIFVNEKQWKNFISAFIIVMIISFVTSEDMFVKYHDTKNGAFAIICACIWTGLFNSIQSICRERSIVKKEHRTGLHISSYIFAHVIYEAVICAVEALIVMAVVLVKNGEHLPAEGLILPPALDLYLLLFLVTFGSDMLAILVSCIVRSPNTAMTVMPFILIIQLVMSGAVFPLNGGAKTVAQFTLSKWGLDGVVAVASTDEDIYMQGAETQANLKDPDELVKARMNRMNENWSDDKYIDELDNIAEGAVKAFEPEPETLLKAEGMLLAYSMLYILLAIGALKQVDRDKR